VFPLLIQTDVFINYISIWKQKKFAAERSDCRVPVKPLEIRGIGVLLNNRREIRL
jgi:hypothetical protein